MGQARFSRPGSLAVSVDTRNRHRQHTVAGNVARRSGRPPHRSHRSLLRRHGDHRGRRYPGVWQSRPRSHPVGLYISLTVPVSLVCPARHALSGAATSRFTPSRSPRVRAKTKPTRRGRRVYDDANRSAEKILQADYLVKDVTDRFYRKHLIRPCSKRVGSPKKARIRDILTRTRTRTRQSLRFFAKRDTRVRVRRSGKMFVSGRLGEARPFRMGSNSAGGYAPLRAGGLHPQALKAPPRNCALTAVAGR